MESLAIPAPDWPLLGPCPHLRGASWVVCPGCHRPTVLYDSDVAGGRDQCHACRAETPRRGMKNRKIMACERCGRPVVVGIEAEAAHCWACVGFVSDPKQGPRLSLETPRPADIRECCNHVNQACIVREHGRCIALDGERCGWWEKAVRPASRLSGRVCPGCGGEIPTRRRLCDRCRQTRRRTAYRAAKQRGRVSCPQLSQKSA